MGEANVKRAKSLKEREEGLLQYARQLKDDAECMLGYWRQFIRAKRLLEAKFFVFGAVTASAMFVIMAICAKLGGLVK